ncbi:MAG: hypothetical protein CSA68_07080 [Rhodobacterales bacterium]|nr:MAG: hypothetical protein CSA68_07080 [Rhodobacterales bacterium]
MMRAPFGLGCYRFISPKPGFANMKDMVSCLYRQTKLFQRIVHAMLEYPSKGSKRETMSGRGLRKLAYTLLVAVILYVSLFGAS